MKKSLGRRSSSRNHPKANVGFDHASSAGKSGIPVRRAASSDRNISSLATSLSRNMGFMTPMSKRSTSEDRNSLIYSAKRCFTGGTERLSRATTLSTNSVRHSSYGGTRTKRDTRPIEEKEWQNAAQRKIEQFLINDAVGCELLINNSIKPITLKLFLSIVDLLFKKLYGNYERTFLHKDNYISELPFLMKTLHYYGKVEKSWLISVNTARSWCHALACIDFLVTCVNSLVVDPIQIMFPEKYDNDDGDDLWNYQILLPYFQKSYESFMSNNPKYETIQEQLDLEVIEQHISKDMVFEHIESLESDISKIRQESEKLLQQKEKVNHSLKQLDKQFNYLKDEKSKYEEYIEKIKNDNEEFQKQKESMDRIIEKLTNDLEMKAQTNLEMKKAVESQQISSDQVAELRARSDSLQREIDQDSQYVLKYEDLLQQRSLELLSTKKQKNDLIKTYNLEVMKYMSFGLNNAMLDGKQTDEEINEILEVAQTTINSAKLGIESLSNINFAPSLSKTEEELGALEKEMIAKRNTLNKLLEKSTKCSKEKEDEIKNLKREINSQDESLACLKEETQNIIKEIQENERRSQQMAQQLSCFRNNAYYCIEEFKRLLEEDAEKHKALFEEYSSKQS